MSKLFGTDGVRGRVGADLTADLAYRLGRAAAGYFLERGVRRTVLARDTRISGEMLAAAFLSGATSTGVDAVDLGIAPTPAVSSLLSSAFEKAFGAVISASHNPYEDNGIKLFSAGGEKLTVAEEDAIERRLKTTSELDASEGAVGRITRDSSPVESYIASICKRISARLKKTSLVVDAAHGAWAPHARTQFLGVADAATFLNCDFNGTNINENCGSTHLESLDPHLTPGSIGLAFDGDGDRMLIRLANLNPKSRASVPNPKFKTLDGDALLFLFAKHLVPSGPVIGTVMANGSLAAALEKMGREFVRAPVGDREVYETMVARDAGLGGEQSGHIIFRPPQRTGDGAVTALSFLKVFSENYAESLESLVRDLPEPFPQKLVNVAVTKKRPWEDDPELSAAVASARKKLGTHGRLLIRYSGTEPLLRLMAESPDAQSVEEQLAFLEDAFRKRLG